MTVALEKTLKRELRIAGRLYVVAVSPLTLKLTLKGRRKGVELQWETLVNGDAALAAALNASLGRFAAGSARGQGARPGGETRRPSRVMTVGWKRGRRQVNTKPKGAS